MAVAPPQGGASVPPRPDRRWFEVRPGSPAERNKPHQRRRPDDL